ncbi:LRR receptor-like serine/threonine-protein kinase HSL2 [Platanthera guangdongensis]|uniref:LRR receptor-like serine/threonine-protein kinase HSL2 n=1 Tax=Platanthera guangdongensis TaxID=2320717 RepID=A0ABR2N114_9ASPA
MESDTACDPKQPVFWKNSFIGWWLFVFNGDQNNFSGEIPASFFENSMFQSLTLSGNHISGNIPATVGSMTSLSVLDLSNNLLAGAIPESLGSLPLLNALDLSKNKLSGDIPSKLGDLKLNYLNLSVNALTGEIPVPLQIQAYEDSFLSNQNLCAADDRSFPYIHSCRNSPASSDKLSSSLLILSIVLGALLISGVMLICFLIIRALRRQKNAVPFPTDWKTTSFQVVDVSESAIFRGLTEENIIGRGGGGKVYRVSLAGGIVVAVKKIWNARKLDSHLEKEFLAEVKILGSIRHANIVKLLCCISGRNSKLLVYEYLHIGSLDGRLHRRKRSGGTPPLDWQTRLQIAVGAAKGLSYMHHGCSPPIIHRDVKSSNILLDPNSTPRLQILDWRGFWRRGENPRRCRRWRVFWVHGAGVWGGEEGEREGGCL